MLVCSSYGLSCLLSQLPVLSPLKVLHVFRLSLLMQNGSEVDRGRSGWKWGGTPEYSSLHSPCGACVSPSSCLQVPLVSFAFQSICVDVFVFYLNFFFFLISGRKSLSMAHGTAMELESRLGFETHLGVCLYRTGSSAVFSLWEAHAFHGFSLRSQNTFPILLPAKEASGNVLFFFF